MKIITWGKSIRWQASGWPVTNDFKRGIVIVTVVRLSVYSSAVFVTPSAMENSIIPPHAPYSTFSQRHLIQYQAVMRPPPNNSRLPDIQESPELVLISRRDGQPFSESPTSARSGS